MQGYDEWKTASEADRPRADKYCSACDAPLYEGDSFYLIEGETLCEECLKYMYRKVV